MILATPGYLPCPAARGGDDAHGAYADLTVADAPMRLRWIPPGSFTMGSPASEGSRWDLETPHGVTLSRGFWLSDAPVTQSLWRTVMGDNPSGFPGDERPVERVSWEDCQRFLAALNARVPGLAAGLPTEAQWEHACRGGFEALNWIASIDGRRLGRVAWFHGNSGGETQPVRAKAPNPFGLYDMLGNVWEWCEDWYAPYPESAAVDPVGASAGVFRIVRGGAFVTGRWFLRAAYRMGFAPANRDRDLGFRIRCDVGA